MPALVKYPAKGMKLSQSVSAVYVDMEGFKSIDVSGYKTLTMPTESLDAASPVKTKKFNGFTEPPTIKGEAFYDPAATTWVNYNSLMPSAPETNFKVTYPDAAPTAEIYKGVGFSLNKKGAVGDALMCEIEIETSGPIT